MDANSNSLGDQAFVFIGSQAFQRTTGELRFDGGFVEGDTDRNGTADFRIQVDFALAGGPGPVGGVGTSPPPIVQTLHASDFVL